jgi:hypothetical protein
MIRVGLSVDFQTILDRVGSITNEFYFRIASMTRLSCEKDAQAATPRGIPNYLPIRSCNRVNFFLVPFISSQQVNTQFGLSAGHDFQTGFLRLDLVLVMYRYSN